MKLLGKNIIGYTFSGKENHSFHAVNPADNSISSTEYCIASDSDIESALDLATRAAPVLAKLPSEKKVLFLDKIAENILAAGDLLLITCQFETGLPESRIISERGRTISQIKMFSDYIRVCDSAEQMLRIARNLPGQLTITVFCQSEEELVQHTEFIDVIQTKAGRIVFNGVPTGVEVCSSMNHGGPFPASTDSRFTSVGTSSIKRWARPVAFQDCPVVLLPSELKPGNPLKIWRSVNGNTTRE